MDIARHPELLDRLAAAYALGSLRHGARRRFEQMAREQPPVRVAARLWQERWSALAEIQAPVRPDDAVWICIDNLLQAEKARAARQSGAAAGSDVPQGAQAASGVGGRAGWGAGWSAAAWWRGAALAGACATVAAVVVGLGAYRDLRQATEGQVAQLRAQVQVAQAAARLQYVAVLADARGEASVLVTFDPGQRQLVLQRVGGFQEAADRSLQLWALPPQGGPRSLGVLDRDRLQRLPAGAPQVEGMPALAISLEPRGGVPGEAGPTGPVLFKGALIRREL